METIEKGKMVIRISLDLAYDIININILIEKLELLGGSENILATFSFMFNYEITRSKNNNEP